MITMARVGRNHYLALNTKNDTSYVFNLDDFEQANPLMSFDSSLNCFDAKGSIVGRIATDSERNWVSKNNLGIVVEPVPMGQSEGVFLVEAEFAQKWLQMQDAAHLNTLIQISA